MWMLQTFCRPCFPQDVCEQPPAVVWQRQHGWIRLCRAFLGKAVECSHVPSMG